METNVNYAGAPLVENVNDTVNLEDCIDACENNAECFNWFVEATPDYSSILSCELRGEIPDGEASVAKTGISKIITFHMAILKLQSIREWHNIPLGIK